jgi:hypothetical protein
LGLAARYGPRFAAMHRCGEDAEPDRNHSETKALGDMGAQASEALSTSI